MLVVFEVTGFVHLQLILEQVGVGRMSNRDEDTVQFQLARATIARIFEHNTTDNFLVFEERNLFSLRVRLAFNIDDSRMEHELDLRILSGALQHDAAGTKFFAAMNKVHLVYQTRQ
jgi:hypothetical protein